MMTSIQIRHYTPADLPAIVSLFKQAVANINIQHYNQEQVAAWTTINVERWQEALAKNITFVACINDTIVGFADMTHEGYLDRLYVHKDYQGKWISLHLFKAIEKAARELDLSSITTDCSITARIPAERMGFKVIKEQTVEKLGQSFINYHMEKKLS